MLTDDDFLAIEAIVRRIARDEIENVVIVFGNEGCQEQYQKICDAVDVREAAKQSKTQRMDPCRTAIMFGQMTINDCRRREGLPEIGAAGDVRYFPVNLTMAAEESPPAQAPQDLGNGMG